ncbi:hypothetical protein NP233_g9808 [Leucocoprinus birnbaumii]|uniref:Uncharacterized protein n=1 Tax=Leucocoprinus birnbaumii TaxID=56174 RepID=A0AAD5VJZ7_9AGAR|nr:hypothetical protein NP233_g9808 [Leucocoprinus birnbaumii]
MTASPSKRSARIKQNLTGGATVPRQYRCRKCPDNPLLKDCLVHGKKNKELQRRQTLVPNASLPSPATSSNDSAAPEQGEGTDPSRDAMDVDDANIDPRLRGLQADGTRRTPTASRAEDTGVGNGHDGTVSIPDEGLPNAQAATPSQSTSVVATNENTQQKKKQSANDDDDDWEDDDDDEVEDEDVKDGGPHGLIEGVMRGNYDFRGLKRTTALRPPSQTSTHASKRFHRVIRQILTRIENLAVETGCWIYFAAQHATAVTPYIHYASPRLRTEAGPELDIIHTNFSIIMKTLVMARRREVMELTLELEENRERLQDAQKNAEDARRAALELEAESARKDAVIAKLMAQMKS